MHENMKTSMWHTGRSERTCRLPACNYYYFESLRSNSFIHSYSWCCVI